MMLLLSLMSLSPKKMPSKMLPTPNITLTLLLVREKLPPPPLRETSTPLLKLTVNKLLPIPKLSSKPPRLNWLRLSKTLLSLPKPSKMVLPSELNKLPITPLVKLNIKLLLTLLPKL